MPVEIDVFGRLHTEIQSCSGGRGNHLKGKGLVRSSWISRCRNKRSIRQTSGYRCLGAALQDPG